MATATRDVAARERPPTKMEQLEEHLRDVRGRMKLDGWSEFTEQVQCPQEFAAAMITGRTELIKLVKPRALSEEECRVLYHLIGVLIETNAALQEHAREVGKLVKNWGDAFTAMQRIGGQIENYTNFNKSDLTRFDQDDPEEA